MACRSEVHAAVINAQMRLGFLEIAAALKAKKQQKSRKVRALEKVKVCNV